MSRLKCLLFGHKFRRLLMPTSDKFVCLRCIESKDSPATFFMPMDIPPSQTEPTGMSCHTFIQWKGTEVCMDFTCECGNSFHIDDEFAYCVKCLACGKVWKLGTQVSTEELKDIKDEFYINALTGDQEGETDDMQC